MHRYPVGAYKPGRHESHLPKLLDVSPEHLGVWWYGYAPWTEHGIERKLQIQSTMAAFDKKVGFGHQHVVDRQALEQRRIEMLSLTGQLDAPDMHVPLPKPIVGAQTRQPATLARKVFDIFRNGSN